MQAVINVFLMAVLLSIALGGIIALPIMWLWNAAVVGTIPGVLEISYFNAWGLFLLCSILFKTNITRKG